MTSVLREIARPLWRGARIGAHLTLGALIALYIRIRFPGERPPDWSARAVRWWHGRLCRALGIRIRVEGRLAPASLLVGNHVSWLDIPVLGAQGEIGFVAKSEVRTWPLIGWMAGVAGTHFIARGKHQADLVAARLAARLEQGQGPMIFPEGTTTDGRGVGRFHARLFKAAHTAGGRIQPVAIRYQSGEDPAPDPRAAYIGEDRLLASLWRILRHPNLVARIQFLPPIAADAGDSRRLLAERARAAIVAALEPPTAPQAA